jgi:CHAD domain-containing protein
MKNKLPGKWLDNLPADESARRVAALTLRRELNAVLRLLPLAADKADRDIEHVHRLRVRTRRASAALTLYEEFVPRRHFQWLQKRLKLIRKAVDNARNCDVLIERLQREDSDHDVVIWLHALRRERAKTQKLVIAARKQVFRSGRFKRRIVKLVRKLSLCSDKTSQANATTFQEWGPKRLRPLVEQFIVSVPVSKTDEIALHKFRIQGKQLRYAIELLAAVLPSEFRTRHYPLLKELQDRLGEINDIATAEARLQQQLTETSSTIKEAVWTRLLARERLAYSQACHTFWDWLSPQILHDLSEDLGSGSRDAGQS